VPTLQSGGILVLDKASVHTVTLSDIKIGLHMTVASVNVVTSCYNKSEVGYCRFFGNCGVIDVVACVLMCVFVGCDFFGWWFCFVTVLGLFVLLVCGVFVIGCWVG